MKSSKGKGPANGVAKTPKKLAVSSSVKMKEKPKDPVEVRSILWDLFLWGRRLINYISCVSLK